MSKREAKIEDYKRSLEKTEKSRIMLGEENHKLRERNKELSFKLDNIAQGIQAVRKTEMYENTALQHDVSKLTADL